MYAELVDFLDKAMLDCQRVEFLLLNGEKFSAVPGNVEIMEDDDGEEYMGCFLSKPEGRPYASVPFSGIVSVRRLDDHAKIVLVPGAKAA